MRDQTEFKCGCGQVTEIEIRDGKECYKMSRHGNREPWEGKCFNCRTILIKPAAAEKIKPIPPVPDPVVNEPQPPPDYTKLSRKKLIALAQKRNLLFDDQAGRKKLIEILKVTK